MNMPLMKQPGRKATQTSPNPWFAVARHESPLGVVWLATHREQPDALAGLWFHDQQHFPADLPRNPIQEPTNEPQVIQAARRQLDEYFAGRRRAFDLPLAPQGSAFQHKVWHALRGIAFGALSSYGELAQQLGLPSGARAVGTAVGRNPVSIVIPCHRVVGRHGALTGYAGGLARKRALLSLEDPA